MLLRRSRSLVVYWHDGDLVLENYCQQKNTDEDSTNAFAVDPMTLDLLARFEDWADDEAVAVSYARSDPDSALEAIKTLTEFGVLCSESDWERQASLEREWRYWSREARFFHFATKDGLYFEDDWAQPLEPDLAVVHEDRPPPPAIFKSDPQARRIYLPRAQLPLRAGYGEVLAQRRTHRNFAPEPVDLLQLSTLLFHTFAPMHFIDAGQDGTVMLRTSPSGGAAHELECYLGALNVDDLQPGLYHYAAESHSLELLDTRFDPEVVRRLAWNQPMCVDAAFVCILTAVFWRSMYKYRHPRAYRIVLLDAGHLAQTFALTCTALGLGPFQTAAFRDSELEQALGIDGLSEGVIYLLGAGRPAATPNGLPKPLRPAGRPPRP